MRKIKTITIILLISLSLTLVACDKEPEIVDELVSDSNQEIIENYQENIPEAEVDNDSAEAEQNPEKDEVEENAETTTADEVKRSFAPNETGAEPNPDSDFAKLAVEEREILVDWLGKIANSYQELSVGFQNFTEENMNEEALEAGSKIGDLPQFQEFKTAVEDSIRKAREAGEEMTVDAASGLKEKAENLNAWYENFLNDLAELNLDDQNLADLINEKVNVAVNSMQEFLDELQAFTN